MIALLGGPLAPTASMGRKLGGRAEGQASAAAKKWASSRRDGRQEGRMAGRQAGICDITHERGGGMCHERSERAKVKGFNTYDVHQRRDTPHSATCECNACSRFWASRITSDLLCRLLIRKLPQRVTFPPSPKRRTSNNAHIYSHTLT